MTVFLCLEKKTPCMIQGWSVSEKESWGQGGKGGVRLLQAESLRFGVVE